MEWHADKAIAMRGCHTVAVCGEVGLVMALEGADDDDWASLEHGQAAVDACVDSDTPVTAQVNVACEDGIDHVLWLVARKGARTPEVLGRGASRKQR